MISTLFFCFVVFDTFTSNARTSFNPWRSVTNFNFRKFKLVTCF
jgi:hypothetical protein